MAGSGGQQVDVLSRDHTANGCQVHLPDVPTRLLTSKRLDRSTCATRVEPTGKRAPPGILLLMCMHLVLQIILKQKNETAD